MVVVGLPNFSVKKLLVAIRVRLNSKRPLLKQWLELLCCAGFDWERVNFIQSS